MKNRDKQQRLNQDIAYELDKYQVILEYGRLFLDRDKAIRDKYKWISHGKWGCFTSVAIDVVVAIITALISADMFSKWLPYMLVVLVLSLLIYILFVFSHRKSISNLVGEKDKDRLERLLDNLQKYLHQLGEWSKSVDSHIKQTDEFLEAIDKPFDIAKSKQADDVNELARIYGTLDETLDAKAHEFAEARLQQFKQYIYKYG